MSSQDIACQQLVELLSDHLERTLPADERARVVAHLSTCGGCTAALEQLRETVRVAGSLEEPAVEEPERERVRQVFRRWLEATPPA
jgi:anti-sigma factor RsiW